MKRCPFCAEEIQDAAIVCKHCGRELTAAPTAAGPPRTVAVAPSAKPKTDRWPVVLVLVGFVMTLVSTSGVAGFGLLAMWAGIATGWSAKSRIMKALGGFVVATILAAIGIAIGRSANSPAPATMATRARPVATTESRSVHLPAIVNVDDVRLVIGNATKDDWSDVQIEINGGVFSSGYTYRLPVLLHGTQHSIGFLEFSNSDGTRFNPFQVKPQQLTISAKLPSGQLGIAVLGWK